jgi:hypothetical protein
MLRRVRNSRGKPRNASAAFIQPCRPTVAAPPRGNGWVHESWIKMKNPKGLAAMRIIDGIF